MPSAVQEPAREIPVIHEADLCVLGGSCTGLFAAIRAVRLGLRVVIVEKQNCFGGVATISMVNVWHSFLDTEYKKNIIGGLSVEIARGLEKRGAVQYVPNSPSIGLIFNSEELKIDLDEAAREHRLKIYFHTMFCAPFLEEGKLAGVIVENKSGRGAIRARMFVDATGDADLCARLPGIECYYANHSQPATTCMRVEGWRELCESNQGGKRFDLGALVREHGAEFGMPPGFSWGCFVPNSDIFMIAGTRIYDSNPADADELTESEIEGRRQTRAILDIVRAYYPNHRISLQALPSRLGLRESRHVRCRHQLTGDEVRYGKSFEDRIANGSYRVDIHHQDKPGITLQYLDGKQEYHVPGMPSVNSRWRPETAENPTYYQIPLSSMLPLGPYENVIVAGRMIDADSTAHGAIRVMVNMSQTGEAAGVACWMALRDNKGVGEVDPGKLRGVLMDGGSLFPE